MAAVHQPESMRTAALRYGFGVGAVAVAMLLTRLLWSWIEPHPTALFLAAVAPSPRGAPSAERVCWQLRCRLS